MPAIVALLADDMLGAGREVPGDPAYEAAFAAIEADPNQLLAVAEEIGRVVGCLQLTFIPGLSRKGMWRGQIESVRIASGHRGTGLGRRMFEWAIEACRARGCGLVQLTTDKARPEAHRFYESLGFVASHEGMKLAL
ncbi:GNAT family N-acetyltransferase [Roseomonas sp. HF4]|uniref:GNAT family N-acetyltransferase n=1 Tax=Roseomonas sp. HF4 TaxID=2562313 RepID=UPI001F0D7DB4|nr:GNAT family N-acetyltransferase [Roseomonas sp. HF4]